VLFDERERRFRDAIPAARTESQVGGIGVGRLAPEAVPNRG
jgi:hypothetical protein